MMSDFNVLHGDCLEIMRGIESQTFDITFTSPPYNDKGITTHKKYKTLEFRDDWLEWQIQCIDEMLRITKTMVLYNVQPIKANKQNVWRLIGHYADKIDQILIWYKPVAQPQPLSHRISAAYEMVLVIRGKGFKVLKTNSTFYRNVIVKNCNTNNVYSDIHNAVMAQPFCDEIIREFTQDGQTVFDPFAGLGTTGISCLNMGRNFVGCEIDPEYYSICVKRLEDVKNQYTLFNPVEYEETNQTTLF